MAANRTMTTTSIVTVTPKIVLVNRPRAITSLTTAITEGGDKASKTAAPSTARARRWLSLNSAVNEMWGPNR